MGMIDLFDGADLSGAYEPIAGGEAGGLPGIDVDEIYHGGAVAVDEDGVVAAAGSMVVQVAGIGPGEITLDHPFLFLIRHIPTGSMLFLGQVTNPVAGSGGG